MAARRLDQRCMEAALQDSPICCPAKHQVLGSYIKFLSGDLVDWERGKPLYPIARRFRVVCFHTHEPTPSHLFLYFVLLGLHPCRCKQYPPNALFLLDTTIHNGEHPNASATTFIFDTTNVFVRVPMVVSLHSRASSQKVFPSSLFVPFIPDCMGRLRLHSSPHHQSRGPSHAFAIVAMATFLALGSCACVVDLAILLCDVGMVLDPNSHVEPHVCSLEDEHV